MAGMVGPPSIASAAPLQETSSQVVVPECTASVGDVTASLGVWWSDRNSDLTLSILQGDEVIAYEDVSASTVEWDGDAFVGHITLIGRESQPAGTADFRLDVVLAGEPTTETSRWRDGNTTVRETEVRQPAEVTHASITVDLADEDPVTFSPTGCTGTSTTTLTVTSQPDTVVSREAPDIRAECVSRNADGDLLHADVSSFDGPSIGLTVVSGTDPADVVFGTLAIDFSRPPQPIGGTVELLRFVGEEIEPAGTAVVDLASQQVGRTRSTLIYQGGRDRFATTSFRLDGTVTVEGLAPFPISGCEGSVTTAFNRTSSPTGPGSGGPAPANDTPENAAELKIGAPGANVQTRGTAVDLEASMTTCEGLGGEGSPTPGHSVWFRVTGTGAPVTLDPSGSSVNTVLAVYQEVPGHLEEIACVDDLFGVPNPSTQPSLTIDTVSGATYLVQVAGYAQQFGRVRLAAVAG